MKSIITAGLTLPPGFMTPNATATTTTAQSVKASPFSVDTLLGNIQRQAVEPPIKRQCTDSREQSPKDDSNELTSPVLEDKSGECDSIFITLL
jgi:hypothetical protein